MGGGGFNGVIHNVTAGEAAALLRRGFATDGSDSGHQQAEFGPVAAPLPRQFRTTIGR